MEREPLTIVIEDGDIDDIDEIEEALHCAVDEADYWKPAKKKKRKSLTKEELDAALCVFYDEIVEDLTDKFHKELEAQLEHFQYRIYKSSEVMNRKMTDALVYLLKGIQKNGL